MVLKAQPGSQPNIAAMNSDIVLMRPISREDNHVIAQYGLVIYLVKGGDGCAMTRFLSAYTKFFKLGNRVAIEATKGKPRGIFLKRDLEGWTGIAFVNPEDRAVNVSLKAINDSGNIIAEKILSVPAGAKIVGNLEVLMDVDIQSATYLRYNADGNIIGFSLNGSADGKMLDGLPAAFEKLL